MGKSIKELNEELGASNARLEGVEKQLDQVTSILLKQSEQFERLFSGMRAADRPVVVGTYTDAQDLGDPNEHGLAQDGADGIVQSEIEVVEGPISPEKAEALAFFAEPVEIHITDTSEKQADPLFEVSVNGRSWVFVRNRSYTVPRYVVAALCQAKPVHYRNEEYIKDDGSRSFRWPSHRGLRYPFSVINDPNPKGLAWLRSQLAAA